MSASPTAIRICLVDMNNGVANQATRCFRRIIDAFQKRVTAANPELSVTTKHVQPRNLGELPDASYDFVLSGGGPGAPQDGFDDPWGLGFRKFMDDVRAANLKDAVASPKLLVVCHSFELAVLHFKVCEMRRRPTLKFGVMPAYLTERGQSADFLRPFGYRLFTWEHRNWEAVNADAARLAEIGGEITAMESHAKGVVNTGEAILGIKFGPGIDGTQFHPEADKRGVLTWIEKPEHALAVEGAYGRVLYDRMIKSLANPERLARTFALCIPGWLTYRFNALAAERGYKSIASPELDMQEFDVAV